MRMKKQMTKNTWLLIGYIWLIMMVAMMQSAWAQSPKLRLGVDGLSHGHVFWVFNHKDSSTFDLVGIAEPNRELAERLSKRFGFSMDIVYPDLKTMLKKTKPEAVAAFNSTFEHLETVKQCAPKGIHVMVEKPLAVSTAHASEMAALARKYGIHLITNYETTWYPSNHFVNEMLNEDKKIGEARRIVVNDGHWGPKEINVSAEFLAWLTDPELNGGGAITDFGCYGANLITWLKQGKRPKAVYATASTFKPEVYERVDDDATILLEYEDMTGVIQASWNWPYSRKDMEVYGQTGYVIAKDKNHVAYQLDRKKPVLTEELAPRATTYSNAFDYFKGVVRGEVKMNDYDLSALENNLLVVEILEAAKESVRTGKKIQLDNL